MFLQNLLEIPHVIWQLLHSHGSVFNHRNRFVVSGNVCQKPQACLTQSPHPCNLVTFHNAVCVCFFLSFKVCLALLHLFEQHFTTVVCKFDNQHRLRTALNEESVLLLSRIAICSLHNMVVHKLNSHRIVPQSSEVSLKTIIQVGKMNTQYRFLFRRKRQKVEFQLGCKSQCTFTSAKELGKIGSIALIERIQSITIVSSRHTLFGKRLLNSLFQTHVGANV